MISTTTWSAVIISATARLASTIRGRLTGAARRVAAGAGLAVENDADAGEHAVQRDEEADGADGGEAHVVQAGNRRADRRECGCDHEREQDRRQ